jgi:hypothetical protein
MKAAILYEIKRPLRVEDVALDGPEHGEVLVRDGRLCRGRIDSGRLSLEPDPSLRGELPLRQGRAIRWITEALAPPP